jgi:hypothetical protein
MLESPRSGDRRTGDITRLFSGGICDLKSQILQVIYNESEVANPV